MNPDPLRFFLDGWMMWLALACIWGVALVFSALAKRADAQNRKGSRRGPPCPS